MSPGADPILALRGWTLERHTPSGVATILHDIDLDLHPGRWLAILGANGSGKSSLLKYLASDESPLADRAAIMFQDPDDQIFAGAVDRELALGRPDRDPAAARAAYGLGETGDLDPRLLSAGQKQRLVLAVALGQNPDALLCDEPTSLQDAGQAAWVLDRLDRWRHETGGALVTATCDRAEAARADDLLLLADGGVAACGPREELWDDPRILAVLGGDATERSVPVAPGGSGSPVLTLRDVRCGFAGGGGFAGVELDLRPGQRVGIVGSNGCGKSTLLALAAGARRPDGGAVRLVGRDLYRTGGRDLDHGAALLAPQFPEYLFTRATVADEVALDPALAAPDGLLAGLGLPGDLLERNPHDLSAGQRRRLALGLVLGGGRPVILLDEPTAALDADGRARVVAMLDELPATTALLVASHDRDFLRRTGCRIRELTSGGLADED